MGGQYDQIILHEILKELMKIFESKIKFIECNLNDVHFIEDNAERSALLHLDELLCYFLSLDWLPTILCVFKVMKYL